MEYPVGIFTEKFGFIITKLSSPANGVNLKAKVSSPFVHETSSTMEDIVKQKNILIRLIVPTVALDFKNRNVRQVIVAVQRDR